MVYNIFKQFEHKIICNYRLFLDASMIGRCSDMLIERLSDIERIYALEADFKKETGSKRIFGWRLVLGYASVSGDSGNKENGIGKYYISFKQFSALQCI